MAKRQTARLFALIAREARSAVVFRRGPSKSVLLLAWDLKTDTIQAGQWFKGRIYERRGDLSPDGQLLVYFAASYRGPWRTWTAISRPPYLTALAAWPKGDAWGGGGLFHDNHSLELNHWPDAEMHLAPGYSLPRDFNVGPLGPASGRGEDDPISSMRAHRDGWSMMSPGHSSKFGFGAAYKWRIDPPTVLEKPLDSSHRVVLRTNLHGIGERDGSWYAQTGRLAHTSTSDQLELGRVDWADVDHNGDLLFAREGCLFRLPLRDIGSLKAPGAPKLIADLNDLRFETVPPPRVAQQWPEASRVSQVRK